MISVETHFKVFEDITLNPNPNHNNNLKANYKPMLHSDIHNVCRETNQGFYQTTRLRFEIKKNSKN
jgi:hypothetical protein